MTKEDLEEVWKILTDKEKFVISKRFGFDGKKPQTLEAIGNRLGVTKERVRQLQNLALSQLRRAKRDLEEFGEIRVSPTKDNGLKLRVVSVGKPKKLRWDRKRIKQTKVAIKPPPPEQTDAVRLDWMESEIKTRSVYIDWSDVRNWQLRGKSGITVYATNLRRLIDAAIAEAKAVDGKVSKSIKKSPLSVAQ